ncbi:hypothetical protein [Streptomyces sp. NRRL S-87]|uniref:hypothetical protein n=1 Tax=Streptomyces sp. NRRL S-87 TaxID=1463920 RepID=UPI000690FBCC|nr:hypothetical protein [Streptomyces sp. NRRL S-87]
MAPVDPIAHDDDMPGRGRQQWTTEDPARADAGDRAAVYPGEATRDVDRRDDDVDRRDQADARDPARREERAPADATTDDGGPAPGTGAGTTEDIAEGGAGRGDADGGRSGAGGGGAAADEQPLLEAGQAAEFRDRWSTIQAGFVDDPRDSVREADELVAALMRTLAGTFADRKQQLEGQWRQDGEPATEDLRMALRQYRSFFNRLLAT